MLYFRGGAAGTNAVLLGIVAIAVAVWSLAASAANVVPAWINLLVGVWMFISPWVLGYAVVTPALWNALIVGLLLAIVALARMSGQRSSVRPRA